MNVLFLDIDGVVNSGPFLARETDRAKAWWASTLLPNQDYMIDSAAVALLNKLVAESGATVVLSSSWRYSHTPAHMTRTLKAHGATFEVVDQTPLREDLVRDNRPSKCRGDEIDAWLQDHPGVESFVILDDSSDMGQHDWRLVKTSFEVGLTAEKVEQAMRFFRGEE